MYYKTSEVLHCKHPQQRSGALVLFQVTLSGSPRCHGALCTGKDVQEPLLTHRPLPYVTKEQIVLIPGKVIKKKSNSTP